MTVRFTVRDVEDLGYEPLSFNLDGASSCEEAAEMACERWHRESRWTGSPPEGCAIELVVVDALTGKETRVDVYTRYSLSFHGYQPRNPKAE